MDYRALLDRILETVDTEGYQTPAHHVEPSQRAALAEVQQALQSPEFDAQTARALVERLFTEGKLNVVHRYSALHVIACHPRVRAWDEAARLVGAQEMAALDHGGPYLEQHLASVDRHRGVLGFLKGHYAVALEYFTRALERERSAENLGNVMATLIRLGDEAEARDLLERVRRAFPGAVVAELEQSIQRDPDLALLRGRTQ
jgi:tetratricopeptide (TPR) repeat protein